MSATEDAQSAHVPSGPTRPPRDLAAALPFYGALAGSLVALALLASPDLMPDLPRYTCRLPVAHGRGAIEVHAAAAASLQALRVSSGVEAEAAAARQRLAERAESWSAHATGSLAPLAPDAECAARLSVRAELAVALAGEGSIAKSAPESRGASDAANALERADGAVEQAAVAGDGAALRDALRVADLAEAAWLSGGFADAGERLSRWRERERDRGEQFALAAQVIESELAPFQRELMLAWESAFAFEMQSSALAALDAAAAGAEPLRVRPIAAVWGYGALIGAALGALVGFGALASLRAPRRVVRLAGPVPARIPLPDGAAWLHVVSASDPRAFARAASEVAAPWLARGERVLIMDAGRALALHQSFGAAPQWGVGECVANVLPLLGAVQTVGVPGLYLLARGKGAVESQAGSLGRVADEAHRNFSRVIIAMDPAALSAGAGSLAGRALEAWWVEPVSRPWPRASRPPSCPGMTFMPLKLSPSSKGALEVLRARLEELGEGIAGTQPLRPASPVESPAAGPVVVAAASREAFARLARVPQLVECDAQTRERLRFLVWMRRVQSERDSRALTAAGG